MTTERFDIVVNERGTRVVRRNIESLGTSAQRTAGGVNLLQRALIALGGVAVLRSAIGTVSQFEQTMSEVRAVSGATEDQLRLLRNEVRELGATTRFSATDAAQGLTFLARAGFEVEEQLQAVGGTLRLAQAGGLDLASAAEITATSLRGMRLAADQTGRVVDVMAAAAAGANTNVFQLGEALSFVGPVAAGVGVELEETVAAIAALSDAGLQGSRAGTGLRRVMAALESGSTALRRRLEGTNLTLEDIRPSAVGLTTALERLRDVGITTGEAMQLFGQRGGPAFEVLVNAIPRIRQFNEELNESAGTAENMAEIMDDNVQGALFRVRSAWEALQLSFADTGPTNFLIVLLDGLAASLRFLANNVEILNGFLISLAVVAIPRAVLALRALTLAIAGTGIGAIAVLIGTAVGALAAFRNEISVTADGMVSLGDLASAVFERIAQSTRILFEFSQRVFGDLLPQEVSLGFDSVGGVIGAFLRTGAAALDTFLGFWIGLRRGIEESWRGLPGALLDILVRAANGIIEASEQVLDSVLAVFRTIGDVARRVGEGLRLFWVNLGAAARQVLAGNVEDATRLAEQGVFVLRSQLSAAFEDIPGQLGRNFQQNAQRDLLPRIEGVADGAGRDFAESFGEGFQRGLGEFPIFSDAVDDLFSRAREIGDERRAAEVPDVPGLPGTPAPGLLADPDDFELEQAAISLADINRELDQQIDLLRLNRAERERRLQILEIEQTLRERGQELTDDERRQLDLQFQQIQQLEQIASVNDRVTGSQIDLKFAQEELNRAVEEGRLTNQQAVEAYRMLQMEALATERSVTAGFQRGWTRIQDTITDFASQAERTLTNAFSSAEDALVQFVQTGEVNFSRLVDSILADLTRLLARQALSGLLGGLGGGGGLLGNLFGGFRQAGGPVQPDRAFVVGEEGPELFVPQRPGTILPNGAGAAEPAPPPPVNVQVVNVTDPEEVTQALDSPSGERAILNVIRRNRRVINQELT